MFENSDRKWIEKLEALTPLISDEANVGEINRAISPISIAAMEKAGIFQLGIDPGFGGTDVNIATWLRVIEQLAHADGSAGWCFMASGTSAAWLCASLPENGAKEIFGGDKTIRVAGMPAPRGIATKVKGGYEVEGRYQFASGSSFATWFTAGATVYEDGKPIVKADGTPELIALLVPDNAVKRMGNWDVMGMAATASIDYDIAKCFVPKEHTASLTESNTQRGPVFLNIGILGIGAFGHAAVAIGIARRALKEVVAMAPGRGIRPRMSETPSGPQMTPAIADQELFRHDLAIHDAAILSARSYLYNLASYLEAMAAERGCVSQDDVFRIRQIVTYLHDVAMAAVEFAYHSAGTAALRNPSDLGREFRNMRAIMQHFIVDRYTLIDAAPTVMRALAKQN